MKQQLQGILILISLCMWDGIAAKAFRSAIEEDYCPTPKLCYCPPSNCDCSKPIDCWARSFFDDYHPYLGAEFIVNYQRPTLNWKPLLSNRYPQGALYVGSILNPKYPQLGFELGLKWTPGKNRSVISSAGSNVSGLAVGNVDLLTLTRIHLNEYYLDAQFHWPLGCIELFVGAGIGLVNPIFKASAPSAPGSPIDNALRSLEVRSKIIPRLNFGASWMLNEVLGCRAKIDWENTSRLCLNGNANFNAIIAPTLGKKVFQNAWALGFGLFAIF